MPTLPTICRLARALGVKPEELYACEENINGEMANDVET
jgi:hypothetical protein